MVFQINVEININTCLSVEPVVSLLDTPWRVFRVVTVIVVRRKVN